MQGFKVFLTRGNLIELAVAFIMGTAFATVVSAFAQIFLDIIGKIGGVDSLSTFNPYGISVGGFLSALLTFLATAAVLTSAWWFRTTASTTCANSRRSWRRR